MVLEGSFPLYNEFFETHEHEAPEGGWKWIDSYHFTADQVQWFMDKGCKWKKVEAGPGDVILWDSRMMHYGAPAEGDVPRVATCKFSTSSTPPFCLHTCFRSYQTSATSPRAFPHLSRMNSAKHASRITTTHPTIPSSSDLPEREFQVHSHPTRLASRNNPRYSLIERNSLRGSWLIRNVVPVVALNVSISCSSLIMRYILRSYERLLQCPRR